MSFQTDTRLSRQKQIHSLAVYHEAVECITEGSEYRIKFRGPEQMQLSLLVKLPSDFPTAQPHIFIEPCVAHQWVQPSTGRITQAPGLLNFSPHSDLGMVVGAIRREFEKAESLQVLAPPTAAVSRSQESAATTNSSDPVQAAVAALSKEELQEVLDNEVALEKLLLAIDFPPLESITENIKSMQEVITVTAQTNITLETEIETLRDALLCKVEEYHTKKLSLGQTAAKVKMLQSRVEGGVLADQLVRLSVDNEEKSDGIADRFLEKEMPVEEFLTEYIATRQQSHLQKLKADKIKES